MKKLIPVFFIILLLLAGCGGGVNNVPSPSNPGTPKGAVSLTIASPDFVAKTIQPDIDMTIATYDVYGTGPNGTNFRKNGVTGNNVTINALASGEWTITADAYNKDGINIASGFTTVSVINGQTVNANITVRPLSGTGILKLGLSWPSGAISNPVITATLTPKGGTANSISFTLGSNNISATYQNTTINAGYYTLLVYLYDGTSFKWGAAEAVRILAGQTSEGNYPIVPGAGFGGINLDITPDLQNPIDITFNGQQDNLTVGNNMTIAATTSEPVEIYQWYLNGWLLNGETNSSITIGSALLTGTYRLDLVVTKGNIVSSGNVEFSVNPKATPTHTVTATPTVSPLVTPTTTTTPGTWRAMNPMPNGLCLFGIAKTDNGKIYVVGGRKGFEIQNNTYEYDPSDNQWVDINQPIIGREYIRAVAIVNDIYAIGGRTGGAGNYQIVQKYTTGTGWVSVASLHYGRLNPGVAVANGKIYVMGGFYCGTLYNTIEEYDPATNVWTVKPNIMPTTRWDLGAATAIDATGHTKIYAIGGLGAEYGPALSTVEAYDPQTGSWETKQSMPVIKFGFGITVYNNKIYVIGGGGNQGAGPLNSMLVYDPISNTWGTLTNMPIASGELGATEANGKIYAIGGTSTAGASNGLNIVQEYTPVP